MIGQALHPTNGKNQTNNKKTQHELRELKWKESNVFPLFSIWNSAQTSHNLF